MRNNKKMGPVGPGLRKGIVLGQSQCTYASFNILIPLYAEIEEVSDKGDISLYSNFGNSTVLNNPISTPIKHSFTEDIVNALKLEINSINNKYFDNGNGIKSDFNIVKESISRLLYTKNEKRTYEAFIFRYWVNINSGASYPYVYKYMLEMRKNIYSVIQLSKPPGYKKSQNKRKLLFTDKLIMPTPLMKGELPF